MANSTKPIVIPKFLFEGMLFSRFIKNLLKLNLQNSYEREHNIINIIL